MLYKNLSKGCNSKTEKGSYGSCAMHLESLTETCIPNLKPFEHMVTMLRLGLEMLCNCPSYIYP